MSSRDQRCYWMEALEIWNGVLLFGKKKLYRHLTSFHCRLVRLGYLAFIQATRVQIPAMEHFLFFFNYSSFFIGNRTSCADKYSIPDCSVNGTINRSCSSRPVKRNRNLCACSTPGTGMTCKLKPWKSPTSAAASRSTWFLALQTLVNKSKGNNRLKNLILSLGFLKPREWSHVTLVVIFNDWILVAGASVYLATSSRHPPANVNSSVPLISRYPDGGQKFSGKLQGQEFSGKLQ